MSQNKVRQMVIDLVITSRENKIFKLAMMLKQSRGRSEKEMFLIEGMRSVCDAIKKGARLYAVIIKEKSTFDFEVDCPIYSLAPKLFGEVAETVTPQGIIAICYMKKDKKEDISKGEKNAVVMCEKLQDPGNIGTIIRTAHACDCGGVVLSKGCCDLYNPKIIRATMSGIFSIPVVHGADSKETIEYFRAQGYKIVAGALSPDAVDLYSADLTGKVLIIIGNEGNGVEEETLSLCDSVLKIPMRSDAESLNAAVAGAIMIYEHHRQNQKKF